MKTLYINGNIYTGENAELKEAFAVENGVFSAVGSNEDILKLRTGEYELKDLGGRFVCAGFNDSHMHLLNYGKALKTADLTRSTTSVEAIIEKVRSFIAGENIPAGEWVIGRGWNQDFFVDGSDYPLREDLDRISTEHPIALTRACGHMLVTNTKALEVLGVNAETRPPYGGKIELSETGEPNGIFRENAMDMVTSAFPRPDVEKLKDMLRAAQAALNSYGVTSVQTDDFLCFSNVDYEDVMRAYRELNESGELTVRVYEQMLFMDVAGLEEFCEKGYHTGCGDSWFKLGPLKLLGDGSLGTRTAYLDRPYNDDPSTSGMALLSQDELNELFEYSSGHGMQIAVHVIGNGILDRVLKAYERITDKSAAEPNPMRNGIVHCQIMRADQLEKCRELGLHAYIQSIFLDYDIQIVRDRVGNELAETSYNFKTMYDTMRASNGSDCPVELPFVMGGIQCAVTRSRLKTSGEPGCAGEPGYAGEPYLPEQALSVEEAINSFTKNGAYASFEEDIKGQIKKGMLADFTVLSENPFTTDQYKIKDIEICETYVDGRRVFG